MTLPTTRRPIVYLIMQPTSSRTREPLDLVPLYDHGEVKIVLPRMDSPTAHPLSCYEKMEANMRGFDPDIDFLAWAGGDKLSAVMVGMILVNAEEPIWRFNWLRYERHRSSDGSRTNRGAKYVPVVIDLFDPNATEELDDHAAKSA